MRTEEEVLKDFEKLGYKVESNNSFYLRLGIQIDENHFDQRKILINKDSKNYSKYILLDFEEDRSLNITMQEHQLLNELFNLWGWINEEH